MLHSWILLGSQNFKKCCGNKDYVKIAACFSPKSKDYAIQLYSTRST